MELIRKAGNRGRFYPAQAEEITLMIQHWNKLIEKSEKNNRLIQPRAIVSPHAGYVYSGYTANYAHRLVPGARPKRIVVVGPSHHVYIRGISAGYFDAYETPYGYLQGDHDYLKELNEYFHFTFEDDAHYLEHSTETQFPLIHYYNPDVKIVELIYGGLTDYLELASIFEYILKDKDNLIVVSTDLSHFHPQVQARDIDNNCLVGFEYQNLELLRDKCEACGLTGLEAIVKTAGDLYLKTRLLDNRTSGDITGEHTSVVGYMSGAVVDK